MFHPKSFPRVYLSNGSRDFGEESAAKLGDRHLMMLCPKKVSRAFNPEKTRYLTISIFIANRHFKRSMRDNEGA